MISPPILTDRAALARNRARATAMFLQSAVADEVQERLNEVNRRFTAAAVVTGFPDFWAQRMPNARIVPDADTLDLTAGAHDLVIHALSLHWANDPVGQLVQARLALQPDGLLIATLFGGDTLGDLRRALASAESQITGGLSPRIAPMGEVRDLGALLQRAGLALPVADSTDYPISYASPLALMRDLRAMGEGNALNDRLRRPTRPKVFAETARFYPTTEGRTPALFQVITLTGWAPAATQQQPLRPGSARQRLADALRTDETPLPAKDD